VFVIADPGLLLLLRTIVELIRSVGLEGRDSTLSLYRSISVEVDQAKGRRVKEEKTEPHDITRDKFGRFMRLQDVIPARRRHSSGQLFSARTASIDRQTSREFVHKIEGQARGREGDIQESEVTVQRSAVQFSERKQQSQQPTKQLSCVFEKTMPRSAGRLVVDGVYRHSEVPD
jgi:hypothetical protein